MINSGYIVKVYCLDPVKNIASTMLAASMKSESWMKVAGMWTSNEDVSIAEFECATFEVTYTNIQAARIQHRADNTHKCNHDA